MNVFSGSVWDVSGVFPEYNDKNIFSGDVGRGVIEYRAHYFKEDPRTGADGKNASELREGVKNLIPCGDCFPCLCWVETPHFDNHFPYSTLKCTHNDEAIAEARKRCKPESLFDYHDDDLQARIDAARAMRAFNAFQWNEKSPVECFDPQASIFDETAVRFMNLLLAFPIICEGDGSGERGPMDAGWIAPLVVEDADGCFDRQCDRFTEFVIRTAAANNSAESGAAFVAAFEDLKTAVAETDVRHPELIEGAYNRAFEALRQFYVSLRAAQIRRACPEEDRPATVADLRRIAEDTKTAAEQSTRAAEGTAAVLDELAGWRKWLANLRKGGKGKSGAGKVCPYQRQVDAVAGVWATYCEDLEKARERYEKGLLKKRPRERPTVEDFFDKHQHDEIYTDMHGQKYTLYDPGDGSGLCRDEKDVKTVLDRVRKAQKPKAKKTSSPVKRQGKRGLNGSSAENCKRG